jgi:c-di-GMP-binding flagellar brake protein YcgR
MSFQYVPFTGEEPPPRLSPTNRRASVRYQCGLATPGRVLLGEGEEWQRGWVLDLSLGGVGLLLDRQLETGSPVVIVLKCATQQKTFELVAHVCRASRQQDGDWMIGCEFETKLTADDLDVLLQW